MKKSYSLAAAFMLAATLGVAQTAPAPTKPGTPAPPSGQKPAPAPAATPAAAPGAAATAPKTAKPPEAKTPEEFKAYQEAVAITDAAAAEAAADDFAKKFPASELRVPAYSSVLQKAYQTNDAAKIIVLGRKVLAIEPDNAMTQVVTGTALAETTKETDLDFAEKSAEAIKLTDAALKNIETMLPQPNLTPEQFSVLKNVLRSMAYSAKGYMAMNRKDFLGSEDNFQKAVTANPQPDPVLYLRLAVAQDSLKKYAAAFANATKSLQIAESQNNTVVANLARGERDRLQKLMGSSAATKPAVPATPPKN